MLVERKHWSLIWSNSISPSICLFLSINGSLSVNFIGSMLRFCRIFHSIDSGDVVISGCWVLSLNKCLSDFLLGWIVSFVSPSILSLLLSDSRYSVVFVSCMESLGLCFHTVEFGFIVICVIWISSCSLNKSSVFLWTSWARSVASSPLISTLLSINSILSSCLSLARLGFH